MAQVCFVGAIFCWVSKVVGNRIVHASLRFVIGF